MFKIVIKVLVFKALVVYGSLDSEEESMIEDRLSDFSKLMHFGNVTKLKELLSEIPYFCENVTKECQRDMMDYLSGICEGESWALKMLDSMEKLPSGILGGRSVIIGLFSECISVKHENFTGKHCLVELTQNKNKSFLPWPHTSLERARDSQFSYGVCLPSTCNSNDIKNILRSLSLQKILSFDVNDTSCSTATFQDLRGRDWTTIFIICAAVVFSLASTAYELYCISIKKLEASNSILASFSLYSNGKRLFALSDNYSELKALNGFRFISITWVVLGHLYSSIYHSYLTNNFEAASIINDKLAIPGTNGYISVDTFFFLSGLLACFVFFREISKKGSYDAPLGIIHRYLRLTPPFAFTILIQATIFSRFGNGPVWKQDAEEIEKVCRKTWWMNLLYIENFIYQPHKCLGQSWYLSADMQMFLVSPLILYFMLLLPKLAPLVLIFLTTLTSMISFYESYVYALPPTPSFNIQVKAVGTEVEYQEYRRFYTRMGPYIIGIATGYILCGIKAKKININLSRKWIFVGWAVASVLCLGSLYGVSAFLPTTTSHSVLEKSLYRSFHRIGWALGVAWVLFACVVGYGGPVNYFLSLNIFQPLAKLSYGVFLIHRFVQVYRTSNTKSTTYYTNEDLAYAMIGDVVFSTILAVPFTLLFEMPFNNIDKWLFQNSKILPLPNKVKNTIEEKEPKSTK